MRILLTADTVGGVWTYALDLARALRERGVEVVLAASGPPIAREAREAAAATGASFVHREAALEWMEDPWEDVRATGEWLLAVGADLEPDVVHLNEYAHASLPWAVPVIVVGHSCVLSWHEAARREPAPPRWNRYRQVVARGLDAADLVVAPTAWMLAQLERLYEPSSERAVIPNGRDPRGFAPAAKEPFVITAGRLWDEGKNAAALERAAEQLEAPVFAAGDTGPWRPRAIRPLGRVGGNELAAWFGRAAVFAAPARYEPFGLTPLEAALSGCALVLGDIESLREVWGDAALYVAPDDDAALAGILDRLLRDERLRAEVSARCRSRAKRYTATVMAEQYLAAYERLAACVPVEA